MTSTLNGICLPPSVVVFGLDDSGKPHASSFLAGDAALARKAAALMSMKLLCVTTESQRLVAERLPKGKVFASGKGFVPFVKASLYAELVAVAPEAVVPDLMDFLNYCVYNGDYKHEFLGAGWTSAATAKLGVDAIRLIRKPALDALEKSRRFEPPMPIEKVAELAKPFLSIGNQYGEGWFLTGEMAELVLSGTPNIVCIQPFACLPNHVVGKGVIKALKKAYPQSNIVAVDYDPGASEVNQLNRIKLMLSTAKKRLAEEEAAAV